MTAYISILTEATIYDSWAHRAFNTLLVPVRVLLPPNLVRRIPGLLTIDDARVRIVKQNLRGRVLDIGCGRNRLVKEYRAAGGEGVGVDVPDSGVGIDIHTWGEPDLIVENSARLPYPDHSFDTITFIGSFFYITNRDKVLQEARRLLAPGGRIILTSCPAFVARIWSTYAFWDRLQQRWGRSPGQLLGITLNQLTEVMNRNGFRRTHAVKYLWRMLQFSVWV